MAAAALAMVLWAQAATAPPAAAAAAPITLGWDAPAGCPDADAVRAEIARGLPPAPGPVAPMRADAAVRALDGGRWEAALALRGTDWTATRTLNGASCTALADAVALVIGLAFTSELAAREVVVARPAPTPAPEPAPISTPVAALALAGDSGTLPAATEGGALALGWRFTHLRAQLGASLYAARSTSVAGFPETGGRLSLASLSARACALWGRAASVGPCAAAGVDRLHGSGTGPIMSVQATSHAPFLAPGLRGEWAMSRRVVLFADVEAAIPLVRARFSVENIGLVHEAAAVSFRGAAGLEVRFR
jgi:hypothetical protein